MSTNLFSHIFALTPKRFLATVALVVACIGLCAGQTNQGPTNFLGNDTFSNINQDLYVSSPSVAGTYTTCQAAVTAAGANNRIIHVPPDYNGPDCPLNIGNNVVLMNEDSTRLYVDDGFNFFQKTGGNTQSMVHMMGQPFTSPGAGGVYVCCYFTTTANNYTVGSSVGTDGGAFEDNITGTLTGNIFMSALENSLTIGSTGGTVSKGYGTQSYLNTLAGSTTPITDFRAEVGLGCHSILGSGAIQVCIGVYGETAAGAATRYNYAGAFRGATLLMYHSGIGAARLDVEDATGNNGGVDAHHPFIFMDNTSTMNIQTPTVNGMNILGASGSAVMQVNTNAVNFFAAPAPQAAAFVGLGKAGLPWANLIIGTAGINNFTFTPAATSAARTVNIPDPGATSNLGLSLNATSGLYQSKRAVAGCTTAASVGGSCATDITVTWATAFPDANYSLTCSGMSPSAGFPSNPFIVSKAAGSAHVNYFAVTAVAAAYTSIDCIAVHD
jgi:hypothetical protein